MKKVIFRFLALFLIVIGGATVVYFLLYDPKPLPIYNPSDINPKLVDVSLREKMKDHTIGDFTLTDQLGRTITAKDFEGKIYVANFMFATCKGICPAMTGNVKKVYTEYLEDSTVKLLSHSVTPEIDSAKVLKAYALKFGIENDDKWHFTTGDRKHIYELARMHYFAAVDSGDGGPDDFVHTENLVLIDQQKRIRGFYDGTVFDEIDRLIIDIDRLKEEE